MYLEFIWDFEPDSNVEHIAEHDLTPDDIEHAFENVQQHIRSRSTGRKALFGWTPDERLIFVAYAEIADSLIHVRTAYEKEI